jgi:hypothetical protein
VVKKKPAIVAAEFFGGRFFGCFSCTEIDDRKKRKKRFELGFL